MLTIGLAVEASTAAAPPLLGPVGRPDSDDEEAQEAKEEPPAKRARVEEGLSLSSEAGTSAQGEVAAAAAPEAEDSAMHDVMDFLAAADLCGAEALAAAVAEPVASEAEAGGAAPSQVETEDQPVKKPLKQKKAKKKAQKPVASTTAETAEATVEAPAEQEDEEALLQEQRSLQEQIGQTGQLSGSATNLVASAVVSPIYVVVTNPLSRLEVIMQTNSIKGKSIGPFEAVRELGADMAKFGLSGIFRGQGIGIFKAIISLTLFHEGRLFLTRQFKAYNVRTGKIPATATA